MQMPERVLPLKEELVIHLCHHDHGGKSVAEAAVELGVTARTVRGWLNSAKKKAPQLFPILTPLQQKIVAAWDTKSPEHSEVCEALGISKKQLERQITTLRSYGYLKRTVSQYRPYMDSDVQRKF
jgi:predicted ArsR family transcriptional regulator